ncbi:MAG: hypothetical protein EZS28_033952 [Streblomastix strix]|uniref:Flavodoxin-like domain-containing protein n=1 Tax=Streblomastix strix TaxID=222440 RepID=A0A5J4UK89_9EUKA|nr:MAG: hypothetical protein EZS28_033952 [Streblomastix strix]
MARALIVYYSFMGTTKTVADLLSDELQKNGITPVVEVVKCSQIKPGIFSALKQLYKTFASSTFTLDNPPENDPRQFDYVFIGFPVWGYIVCPPMDVWLKAVEFDTTRTKFGAFIQQRQSGADKCFELIEKTIGKPLSGKMTVFHFESRRQPEGSKIKVEQFVKDAIGGETVTQQDIPRVEEGEVKEDKQSESEVAKE